MHRVALRIGKIIAGVYVAPTAVYGLAIFLLQVSTSCEGEVYDYYSTKILQASAIDHLKAGESGGYYFLSTHVFMYTVCVAAIIYCVTSTKRFLSDAGMFSFLVMGLIFSAITISLLLMLPAFAQICVVNLYFETPLQLILLMQNVAMGGVTLFGEPSLSRILVAGVVASNLAWWFVAAAAAVTLAAPKNIAPAYDLAKRVAGVREAMYVATLVLISNTMAVSAWLEWPSAYVTDDSVRGELSSFGATLSFYYGTTMTAILGVVFMPILYVLNERALRMARVRASPESLAEQKKWLEQQGLSISFQVGIKDAAAILAPMLAGSLTDLLDALT